MKEKVYAFLRTVPAGKVVTYGQIAAHLGNPRLARFVGNALHHNPAPETIPCHRVVDRNGRVAAHFAFGGGAAQRRLLESEGIVFESDGRVDLRRYGWEGKKNG